MGAKHYTLERSRLDTTAFLGDPGLVERLISKQMTLPCGTCLLGQPAKCHKKL